MKINLSVPAEFNQELDELSERLHTSKSEIVRKAVHAFKQWTEAKATADRVHQQRLQAAKEMDEWRKKHGRVPGWDSVNVIREWRDRDRLARMRA